MLCCAICIDENAQVCTAATVFRRHRWFRLTKNWAWFISHVAGDGAAPSVLRMILICCNIMYWIWRVISGGGPFRGPIVPSQTRCFEGAARSSAPLVIRPLVVSRSRQPLRYIWRWISRKRLEIEACFQLTTNRKWHMGYRMVTWPMTSHEPERSNSWPQYA